MEISGVIVDPSHIFNNHYYVKKDITKLQPFQIIQFQEDDNQEYFLIKKDEFTNFNSNYTFINHIEKSFELIHPSILNIAGFSTNKPNLYYKSIQNPQNINSIKLTDQNIQKIFLGVASGLSYLISKGYYFSNFSINSIIFDADLNPKIIDYIDNKKGDEKELIIEYVKMINFIYYKKMESDKTVLLNEDLKKLIERCQKNLNLPTFIDFIKFFETSIYRKNYSEFDMIKHKQYIKFLQLNDKIVYDNYLSKKQDSIEYICYHFFSYRNNDFILLEKDFYMLNKLPEYYIKPLVRFVPELSKKLIKFLYNENISLILDDWNKISILKPFEIYEKLMNKMKYLENKRYHTIYFSNERKELDYQLDSVRIQAIHFLKKVSKKSFDSKIKIELAIQYIKGNILPINLNKALNILESINNEDIKIKNMKNKLKSTIYYSSLNYLIQKVPQNQREKLTKAEKGDIFSLLFIGFAFYTGFNEFPISHPVAIQCYRKAAKMSADSMALLGYLYLNGIFFPQNLKRARNCFKKAADKGSMKAEIIDSILRKHMWRSYLLKFDINDIFNNYLPSFESMIVNSALFFPIMNYLISNVNSDVNSLDMYQDNDILPSDKQNQNCSTYLNFKFIDNNEKSSFSEKILLSSENYEDTNDVKKQMFIAKSYYYGENGFPVNYSKAINFFKLAADNGDSEAQWRYANLTCFSDDFKKNYIERDKYLEKSSKQNNTKGKLYYALKIKESGDNILLFEKLMNECCESGDSDAMYLYAMYLETIDTSLERPIILYKKAADQGHFDSFIRLTNIYKVKKQKELYKDCLELSVGLLNEHFLIKLIHLFDKEQNYAQSNILIRLGITLNYQLFNFYYIDHLLYGKGMETNIERAKKLSILAFNDKYPKKYQDQYIYSMLQALILNNEQNKATFFLLKYRKRLDEKYNKYFRLFYKYFDKRIANEIYITSTFCCQEYVSCHDELIKFKIGKLDLIELQVKLLCMAKKDKNSFAMALIGKLIKGLSYTRDLKLAIIYFVHSVKNNCPLGCFYLGKEFFYGRCLDQDYEKAKKLLLKAIKDDAEPRAGYYLFKIPGIRNDENVDDVKFLKTGVKYGHKRAIYEYSKLLYTGKDVKIPKDTEKGIISLQILAGQKYEKAIKFCKKHGIKIKDDDLSEKEDDSDFLSSQSNDEGSTSTKEESSFDFIVPRAKIEEIYLAKAAEDENNNSSGINDDVDDDEITESSQTKNEKKNSELNSDSENDISILNEYWV